MENISEAAAGSIDVFLREQAQSTKHRREILGALLSDTLARKEYFLAYASFMGRTEVANISGGAPVPSYTVLHTLEWVSQNIHLGSEMPFMKNKINPLTGRLIVDCSNADEIKQRAPDWTRQVALAAYLAQPQRKFGPLMAVLCPEWVENHEHANWLEGRAGCTSADFTPIEPSGSVGLLKLQGVQVYALDGQHRVLGMRGLRQLRDHGFLQLRTKDGSPRSLQLSRDDFVRDFGLSIEGLQSVFNDTIPVEYTPAAVIGESHPEACRRIRRTFVAINSYARKTDKGENILLDETDGFAIVSRRVAVSHPLFNGSKGGQRVNWKTTSIPTGRTPFLTTLSALQQITRTYLTSAYPSVTKTWKAPMPDVVPLRPTEDKLNEGYEALAEFFDRMAELPIFKRLQRQSREIEQAFLEKWREFPRYSRTGVVLNGTSGYRGHLLLRPLGQVILANAVAELLHSDEHAETRLSLNTIFQRLSRFDDEGGFEAHRPRSLWWGVTYAPTTNRVLNRSKTWGHKLLVHVVSGVTHENDRRDLWWNWVKARAVDLKTRTWKNLDGRVARFDWDVPELPERSQYRL